MSEYNDDELTQQVDQEEVDVTATSVEDESSDELDVNNQSVGTHQLIDKENVPICKYCNKVFANFSNLNHHISAIHLNQSKWVCSQCGKVCSSKSNLKVHLRVHLRVKPYHCRWCTYSCMHHSSIRDHLAKVHPDRTHTPLQPGYIFNSQAVPEPDVFNSKNFNANTFVNETNKQTKRSSESPITPEKLSKRTRVSREPTSHQTQIKKEPTQQLNMSSQQHQIQQHNLHQQPQIQSNMFSAYQMARMLPFMYPMHLQYAAAAAAAAASNNSFNFRQTQNPFSPISTNNSNNVPTSYTPSYNVAASNSFEEQTTPGTSSLTYSTSSRSSSLSPQGDKQPSQQQQQQQQQASASTKSELIAAIVKQMKDQESSADMKMEPLDIKFGATSSPKEYPSSPKNTLTVDQILSNKSTKSTQTDLPTCLHCPYCQNTFAN